MGALSFGVSELIKQPVRRKLHFKQKKKLNLKVEGWFKLMTLEEGELSCFTFVFSTNHISTNYISTSYISTIYISTDYISTKYIRSWQRNTLRCLGEFYNVPVTAEGEDLAANLKKLRVRRIALFNFFSKFLLSIFLIIISTFRAVLLAE